MATGLLDPTAQTYRYYRHAVETHWDPHDVDLARDADAVRDLDEEVFENLRGSLAAFGAGEESVAEDLAPLAVVLDEVEAELFVTTQLYEEAKHADFFDRYWRSVVTPEEERRGLEPTSPTDDHWFSDAYVELFERMEDALDRLLVEDTPETRASAYCHYHLTIEGILAQTGYYGLTKAYGPDSELGLPELPGLVEGLTRIRGDEGRHVGFGMHQLKQFVESGEVDPAFVRDTVEELVPLVQESVAPDPDSGMVDPDDPDPLGLTEYAVEKHTQRMRQITNASEDIPDVDALTALE